MKKQTAIAYGGFSMAQYDEVSGRLGAIEATQSHILKSVNTIESLFKDFSDKIVLHGASIDAAHKRLDELTPKVDTLEKREDERKGAWQVIVWIAGSVGAIFGALAAWLPKFLFP